MRLDSQRFRAKEHRRRLMQGLGRPIISFEKSGYRCVAVGDTIHWSKNWQTFHDFLFEYIRKMLTYEWGQAESAKAEPEQHPLIRWVNQIAEFRKAATTKNKLGIFTGSMTGVVRAYLGLAYDLYLCAHNAQTQELLLKRLRKKGTFEGALYEAYVIGLFARAGFKIEFEDEGDSTTTHCEFIATHTQTGKKFSIEAKTIGSTSSRAGKSEQPPRVRHKLTEALLKMAAHERIVFIELNRDEDIKVETAPSWEADVLKELRQAETDMTIKGAPAPPAYIFLTNRGFMHTLDSEQWIEFAILDGFKIADFPIGRGVTNILDTHRAREKHIEVYWLQRAMLAHQGIPSTFDDRTPAEAFSDEPVNRIRIGDTHLVPDGAGGEVPGIFLGGVVDDGRGRAMGQYQLQGGRHVLVSIPLSATELEIYKSAPDTFFETIKNVSRGLKSPLDCFDFVADTYMKTRRTTLLEWMKDYPNYSELENLPDKELAEHYCAHMATSMWLTINKQPGNAH
jgi:hypothetical protein